jgi:hypothetical protein
MTKTILNAQDLFAAGRRLAPPPGRKGLLRVRVRMLQLEAGRGLGAAASLGQREVRKAALFKASVVVLLSSFAVGATWLVDHGRDPAAGAAATSGHAHGVLLRVNADRAVPSATSAGASTVGSEAPKPIAVATRAHLPAAVGKPREPAARPIAEPSSSPATDDMRLELDLLLQAQAAMNHGNAKRALALLETHAADFPTSRLAQERRAARIFALCSLGNTRAVEGRAQTGAFLSDFPKSPFAPRIRAACNLEVTK